MDWIKITVIFLFLLTVYLMYQNLKLKRDIAQFCTQIEESLDCIMAGKQPQEGKMEDTLFGKINEKLIRVWHILELKGRENLEEKLRLQELVSDISHQSRIPLANQKLYLEILKDEISTNEGLLAVKSLENQTIRISFLLESMIKLSRLETGVIQIKKEEKDILDTIRKSLSTVVYAAEQKHIRLEMAGEETVIRHDSKWTMEAVSNLLDNAVKYTGENGTVDISVKRHEIFLEICVADNGKGILLERQAEIFKRFYREPEVHGQEGIGIGLYLTRKIIELQDGYVDVVSRPGEGAAFRIYLPI